MSIELDLGLKRGAFSLRVLLRLPSYGVTGIFGASGSGKTTLLRCLAGLERDAVGRVCLDDEVWQDEKRFVPTHRRGVGYVFQESALFTHLDVQGNLAYAQRRAERTGASAEGIVDLLGLRPFLRRHPGRLSAGERQRVAIARTLLSQPKLLLMDEPLANVDQEGRRALLPILERLHRRLAVPIVYVSHARGEIARLADYLVLLEAGEVLAHGGLADVLTDLELPAARGEAAEAVVEAAVRRHDRRYGLSTLGCPAGDILVPHVGVEVGEPVRVRIRARDVSLTLRRPQETSILNIFPAVVLGIATGDGPQATIRLQAGGVALLARITRRSLEQLSIKPGTRVFAQVKSVALIDI